MEGRTYGVTPIIHMHSEINANVDNINYFQKTIFFYFFCIKNQAGEAWSHHENYIPFQRYVWKISINNFVIVGWTAVKLDCSDQSSTRSTKENPSNVNVYSLFINIITLNYPKIRPIFLLWNWENLQFLL